MMASNDMAVMPVPLYLRPAATITNAEAGSVVLGLTVTSTKHSAYTDPFSVCMCVCFAPSVRVHRAPFGRRRIH